MTTLEKHPKVPFDPSELPALREYEGLYLFAPPPIPAPGVRYCACYARLSLDKHGDELGVDRQLAIIIPLAIANGYVPVIYVDNSKSATNPLVVRDDYQRLFADVKAGLLSTVACYDTSRFFRDNLEQEIFMRAAAEIEIDPLIFYDGGEKNLSNSTGQFEMRINGAVNAKLVAEMKAKLRLSHDQRAASGRAFWPRRPFGFERAKRDGTGAKHRESEAALIRLAYRDVLRGRSMKAIAREWNDLGVHTPTHENEDGVVTSGGHEWTGTLIRQLLLNARNAGLRERSTRRSGKIVKLGVVGKADWQPIVDEDLYYGVTAILRSNQRTPSAYVRKHLLTSIARCGKQNCGQKMTSHVSSNTRRPTYICMNAGCYGVRRSMADVDKYVLDLVGDRLAADDAKDLCRREKLDPVFVSSVEERIASLLSVRKLQSKLAISGELSADECEENVAEINAKIAGLNAEITEPASAELLEDIVTADDPRAYFEALPLDRRRAVIDYLLTITIKPGQAARSAFNEDLVVIRWKHPYVLNVHVEQQ